MLRAVRRSVVLPSLSIAIPHPRGSEPGPERDSGKDGENEPAVAPEPLHKQVKFLAPDEDEMSDQSSICQSPSWEGYGQRKREKKKEAERRKKEKEQAEKEAKAAKRRLATRLSKSPPPAAGGRTSRASGLTNADRSMSDPLLISQHLLPEGQSHGRPDDVERAASADDLQRFRGHQPGMAEILSDSNRHAGRFVGGVKLDRERESALQAQLDSRSPRPPNFPNYQTHDEGSEQKSPRYPPSDSSGSIGQISVQSGTTKQEGRLVRETFPPSASRTPMLRHTSAPGHNRSNVLLQGATKIFRGRDGKGGGDAEMDRGRHRDGHGQYQREQSTERSVAELAYEQLINNGSLPSSSTRSSSRHTQHTRRSSFTQEARSVAMKLTGIKLTPGAKDEQSGRVSGQNDYFSYTEHADASSSSVSHQISTGNQDGPDGSLPNEQLDVSESALLRGTLPSGDSTASYDRPATAQSLVGPSNPSFAGLSPAGQARKSRSLRDAAKAALHISRGTQLAPEPPQPQSGMVVVPYSTLRAHVDSRVPAPEETRDPLKSPTLTAPASSQERNHHSGVSRAAQPPPPPPPNCAKITDVETHVGSRVSEGSSSSSAYEDGSPLPSPVTTPDTSRPQSSKDLPFIVDEIPKIDDGLPTAQDDDVTLRQSSDGSSTSSTPRLVKSEDGESLEVAGSDRWSRTALPIEIDCDAQSFTTSFSHLDNMDNIDESLANSSGSLQSDLGFRGGILEKTSNPNISIFTGASKETPTEPPISIPPRSKKRELLATRPSTSPVGTSVKDVGNLQTEPGQEESELEFKAVKTGKRSMKETSEWVRSAEARADQMQNQNERREYGQGNQIQRQGMSQMLDRAAELEVAGPQGNAPSAATRKYRTSESDTNRPPRSLKIAESAKDITTLAGLTNDIYPPVPLDQAVWTRSSSRTPSTSPPSPASPRFPRTSPTLQSSQRMPGPPRMTSAPTPLSRPSAAATPVPPPAPSPAPSATRPAGAGPISILKQPTRSTSDPAAPLLTTAPRPPVASALPKHMQAQAGMSVRTPVAAAEARMAPIAKMFVECCNCKFYHDMPSKLYECMAKPDAVVEDKLLGISGAITTMVKCPWCQHNMSTKCCAGYAAVVYLKEKMH